MWQPIETAPMDQFLLLCGPSGYTTTPMVVTTGRMCSDYHAGRWIDHANDDLTDWGFKPTHWAPLTLPGAQPAPSPVAYLDIGAGGYTDIGTDLNDEQLASLPKGRHMLGIVGTYGVDGYVSAQPEPSISPVALRHVIQWLRNGCDPMKAADELEMLAAAPEAKP